MRPAYSTDKIVAPSQWEEFPDGPWLQEQIGAGLDAWWPRIFGYHLLKLGALSRHLPSGLCPVPHQFSLANDQAEVLGKLNALPFQATSIDACLATFCLEYHQDPHGLLREIDRVLISGGHLILVGFNPISALSLGYLWPPNHKRLPWRGRLFTPARVQDWLGVLGYKVLAQECISQHSMLWSPSRFVSAQQAMTDLVPGLGSVFLIVAQKLDCPLTPVQQKWKVRRPLVVNPVPELASRDARRTGKSQS
ncbi:methyltransferase domain-containing protein [Ferrimonas marina]|uniref:Methyltransferase domain-containing protein n=1 Tax=Ferrimonas marina TaxID=299255 RepID=A0A1M5Z411_9GAMM|nr:methyltransferase domain-containing protein [Ferrimonas marina]SHI18960.1 Methyltransferase domain-containing protein [Ferrimonas marina]